MDLRRRPITEEEALILLNCYNECLCNIIMEALLTRGKGNHDVSNAKEERREVTCKETARCM